ncbi:MAG: response regulator [Lachnospiraceae bacterium]|nr:response regulator [Lachnospiraceae bacterium]MDD3659293.1 response regulator [Lachnospiraceae bacterium]
MYRVIVVDDEILVREAICENINWNQLGYELVGNCENGKSAIDFLDQNEVDVVLTDICMPYVDGMELSAYIHTNLPETRIIIFSGYDEFEYAKKAIRYNVEDYLLKPVTAFELSEVLTKLKESMDRNLEQKNKMQRLRKVYNKNRLYLKSNVLLNLIKGSQKESEIRKELDEIGISLDFQAYRIAVIHTEEAGVNESPEEAKKQSALMNFVVYNISDEIIAKANVGNVFMENDNKVYIIFHTNKPKEFLQISKVICEEIMETVREHTGLHLIIGLGSYVYSIGEMARSTDSAMQALLYGMKFQDNQVIDMEQLQDKIKESVNISEDAQELALSVKLEENDKIDKAIDRAVYKIKSAYIEPAKTILYLQELAQSVTELAKSIESNDHSIKIKKEELLYRIATSVSIDEAACHLKKFSYDLGESISAQKNTGQKKYAVMAMDYLEKNYHDPGLSLNFICNYLGISISRFSSVFKNTYQETFMESLIRIRMQRARELIENTDLKNYEIAERVGFTDPHYFSISFKKATGKTPKEYAKEVR